MAPPVSRVLPIENKTINIKLLQIVLDCVKKNGVGPPNEEEINFV